MKFKPFSKDYHGFEDINDLERDISEYISDDSGLSGEFQGTLKVRITYEPRRDEEE